MDISQQNYEPDPDDSIVITKQNYEPDPDDSIAISQQNYEPDPDDSVVISKQNYEPDPDDSMEISRKNYEPDPDDHEVVQKQEPDPDDSVKGEPMEEKIEGNLVSETENVIKRESDEFEPDPDDEELLRIQDPVMEACNRLKKSIQRLRSEVSDSEVGVVFQTLVKIVKNVIEHPDEIKFKKLRKVCGKIQEL